MSHALDRWCKAHIGNEKDTVNSHPPLTYVEAEKIREILLEDASGYLYSAMISIADACNGLERQYFSWATCKLYYSLFYSLRGLLALRRKGLFYLESTPYYVDATPNEKVRKLGGAQARGGTHGSVLRLFCSIVPNHILISQPIKGSVSLQWLKERREDANYGRARYWEPDAPWWFSSMTKNGIRKLINEYTFQPELYAFDPDHAVLALPILAAKCLRTEFQGMNCSPLERRDIQLLTNLFSDRNGKIASIQRIFEDDGI